MDLVEDVSDFNAPEFVVNGPSSIEWISPHQVRITYYCRRKTGNIATHHAIWDIDELLAAHEAYDVALVKLRRESVKEPRLELMASH